MTNKPTTVLRWVSEKMEVPVDEIRSRNRKPRLVEARAQVAHILRDFLKMSYPAIGEIIDRDHTSVINLVNYHKRVFTAEQILDIKDE